MGNASLTFYLNRNSIYYQYYASDGRLQRSAGLTVDPNEYKAGSITKAQKAHMNRLRTIIDNYEANKQQGGEQTLKDEVEWLILDATGRPTIKPRATKDTLSGIIARYISAVRSGEILNDGKHYSNAWLSSADAVKQQIDVTPYATTSITKIREDELSQITGLFTKAGLSKNTVSTYMAILVGIMNKARRAKWYKAEPLDSKSFGASPEEIDHGQYLDSNEIKAISKLPMEGNHAMWRDVFVLGCWLGMRHKDLCRLTPAHRNNDVVNINTTKTGAPVWVPLSKEAKRIWDKYGGVFKVPTKKPFIDFIKDMGKEAGIIKPVLFSRTQGGRKEEKWMPKYDLLGTHTCRRSFATNAYKAGVPVPSIMKVTGHKTHASFLKYIRLNEEEHAELLGRHPHFR